MEGQDRETEESAICGCSSATCSFLFLFLYCTVLSFPLYSDDLSINHYCLSLFFLLSLLFRHANRLGKGKLEERRTGRKWKSKDTRLSKVLKRGQLFSLVAFFFFPFLLPSLLCLLIGKSFASVASASKRNCQHARVRKLFDCCWSRWSGSSHFFFFFTLRLGRRTRRRSSTSFCCC